MQCLPSSPFYAPHTQDCNFQHTFTLQFVKIQALELLICVPNSAVKVNAPFMTTKQTTQYAVN